MTIARDNHTRHRHIRPSLFQRRAMAADALPAPITIQRPLGFSGRCAQEPSMAARSQLPHQEMAAEVLGVQPDFKTPACACCETRRCPWPDHRCRRDIAAQRLNARFTFLAFRHVDHQLGEARGCWAAHVDGVQVFAASPSPLATTLSTKPTKRCRRIKHFAG